MLGLLKRGLSTRIYEANVRLRLQALGVSREAASNIVRANREPEHGADLERVIKIVTWLVSEGWLRCGMPDQPGYTNQDIATALAFCLASDGGRALADHMGPADGWTAHLPL